MGEPAKEGTRSAKKATQKSTKSTTAINKKSKAFTDEERAAMKERAQEARPRAKGGSEPRPARGQGGRGERRAREDRRDAGAGSRHGQAAPCDHQGKRASPLAENLVRDARLCQGRQGRLLLPKRAEVQLEVRDVRLQRQGVPRRRRHVGNLLRAEGVDCHRRGKDQRAREESGELSQLLSPAPRLVTTIAKENQTYCSKLVRSSQGDADADREGGPAAEGGECGKGRVLRGCDPSSCPYSAECVEGVFCEVLQEPSAFDSYTEPLPRSMMQSLRGDERRQAMQEQEKPSLYDRLGGVYNIATVVDDLIDRLMTDPRLNANPRVNEAHHRVSPPGFKFLLTEMVCEAAGGPQTYSGRTMGDSHRHLMITDEEWMSFLVDLQTTLDKFEVPQPEQDELKAIVESTKEAIVVAPLQEGPVEVS